MAGDIFSFQVMFGLSSSKQGKCDVETIQTLIGDTYEGQGFRHQWNV